MFSFSKRLRFLFLLFPLGWGALSYFIFSVIKPNLPITQIGSVPLWMWLWLLLMFIVIPFWVWLSKQGLEQDQKHSIVISGLKLPLGKPKYYIITAYLAGITAIPFHDRWYGAWFVFGGIVSPIFEELFSRNLLTPWLKKTWVTFLSASVASSSAFALMHWCFNNAETFAFTPQQQLLKFFSHFVFAMVLCVVFRFTKSIQLLIWLHVASNLQFILTKL